MTEHHQEATKREPPEMLGLIRRLLGPGLVFLGWQLMAISHAVGTMVAYLGFIVCLLEIVYEPVLIPTPYQLQIVLIGIVCSLLAVFTINVAFIPAPIVFQPVMAMMDYPEGTVRGGIVWRQPFTELELVIGNPTDNNYDDLNLAVKPDFSVAGIGQLSSLSNVSFEDYDGQTMLGQARASGQQAGLPAGSPLVLLATNAGYKVHCGRIPPKNGLKIIMAIVSIATPKTPDPNDPVSVAAASHAASHPQDYFLGAVMTTGEEYWYGNPGNLSLFGPRPRVKEISVSGSFFGCC